MNSYIQGPVIKELREKKGWTQSQLADKIQVSDKTISKWETGRGLPDITLLESLAAALNISVPELLSGKAVINQNRHANILHSKFYICPMCGNIIHATGDTVVSCCGITLPALDAETPDKEHECTMEYVEDEMYLTVHHPMTREHHISFLAYITADRAEIVKLYPEGNAETRFFIRGYGQLYWYCNRHGLYTMRFLRKRENSK